MFLFPIQHFSCFMLQLTIAIGKGPLIMEEGMTSTIINLSVLSAVKQGSIEILFYLPKTIYCNPY